MKRHLLWLVLAALVVGLLMGCFATLHTQGSISSFVASTKVERIQGIKEPVHAKCYYDKTRLYYLMAYDKERWWINVYNFETMEAIGYSYNLNLKEECLFATAKILEAQFIKERGWFFATWAEIDPMEEKSFKEQTGPMVKLIMEKGGPRLEVETAAYRHMKRSKDLYDST